MNLIAKIPLIVAATNATTVGQTSKATAAPMSSNSYTNEAIIIGIDIKNEYSAAFSRLVPVASIVDIVVPLRDNPGMTAMPWAMPAVMDDLKVI